MATNARRRFSPRRALIIVVLVLLVLTVVAAVAIQIVLWTGLPRRLVLDAVREQTGLNVEIASLRTGWSGRTTLRGLTVALPLEDDPFLSLPAAKIEHTSIVPLLLTRNVDITRVSLDGTQITLRENEQGQWNLQRALTVLQARRSSTGNGAGPGRLPDIDVTALTLFVQRHGGEEIRYEPITLAGAPDGRNAWRFSGTLPDMLDVQGRLVPSPPLHHELDFTLDLDELLRPWLDSSMPLAAAGTWSGETTSQGVRGLLRLTSSTVDRTTLSGDLRIESQGPRILLRPRGLEISPTGAAGEPLIVAAGELEVDASGIAAHHLQIAGYETTARADATWNFRREAGGLTVTWTGAALDGFEHDGRLDASLRMPHLGPIVMELNAEASARDAIRHLQTSLIASAEGRSLDQLIGRIEFPKLRWADPDGSADFDGLAARLAFDWPTLSLAELDVPRAHAVVATGSANLDSYEWSIDFSATDWIIPKLLDQPVSVLLVAEGDDERVEFSRLHIHDRTLDLEATGTYLPRAKIPLTARASLTMTPPWEFQYAPGPDEPVSELRRPGRVHANLLVDGSVSPLNLAYNGELTAEGIHVADGTLEPVAMPWSGHVGANEITFDADEFSLLQGRWTLTGHYTRDGRKLTIDLTGRETPLRQIASLLHLPIEAEGALDLEIDLAMPQLDPDRVDLRGDWSVDGLRGPAVVAERGEGRFLVRGRDIELPDIRLTQGDAEVTGTVRFNLDQRNLIWADITTRDWPVTADDVDLAMRLNADANLRIDAASMTAEGEARADADLRFRDAPVGRVALDCTIDGRTLRIAAFEGALLDGSINGAATVPLDDWTTTTGDLRWQGVQLARLGPLFPAIETIRGDVAGALVLQPSNGRHRTDMLRIDVDTDITDGDFRGVTIGDLTATLLAEPGRIILDAGEFALADGRVDLWGRSTRHDGDRYGHTFITLENLSVDQIVRIFAPETEAAFGRVGGRLTVGGYFNTPHRMFGSADLALSASDLAAVPLFSFIYDALKLELGEREPAGTGSLRAKLEGDTLLIDPFRYFNRGTDVAARLVIDDIFAGADSRVGGLAVGAVLPFRDLDLPLAGELDRLINALQANAVSVRIDGTLGELDYRTVPFEDVGISLQRLLRGTVDE